MLCRFGACALLLNRGNQQEVSVKSHFSLLGASAAWMLPQTLVSFKTAVTLFKGQNVSVVAKCSPEKNKSRF